MRVMALLRGLRRNLFRREQAEAALDDELRAYLDLLAADYERAGMSPEQARRAALVKAGGIEQVKEITRDVWIGNAFAVAAREVRYAVRTLRHSPTYLVVSIATLGIGIGGATAVYTVIKGSLLRPLPAVEAPSRLVAIERRLQSGENSEVSYPDYRDLSAQTTVLTGLAGFDGTSMMLEDPAGSARVWVSFVTDNFFSVLGVRPAAGRFFLAGDRETTPVIVLGDALWQRRFGRSARAVGSTVKLNGIAHTIIGVAPPRFIGAMATHPMELWIPVAQGGRASLVLGDLDLESRRAPALRLIGRLAPGKRLADAERDLGTIAARLATTYPGNLAHSVQVLPRTGMTADERADASRVPRLLAVAVSLLLLIACGNVAGLSLVRTSARRRELATRVALGASRGALVRQVAFEGSLVAAGAGVLGVIVAHLLVRSATLMRTVVVVPDADLTIDPRVLAIALGASALAAILISLLPALQISRLAPGAVLKDGGGAVRRSDGQRALVAGQIAATLVLLSASAIIASAFTRVLDAHENLEPGALTDSRLDADAAIKDTAGQVAFFREVLARTAAEPGIEMAALATTVPPFQWSGSLLVFRQGEEPPHGSSAERRAEVGTRVSAIQVSEQFFGVTRVPIVRGRGFGPNDTRTSEPSVIVSRRLASMFWPGEEPVGRMLAWPPIAGPTRAALRVIGVAEDTRDPSLADAAPLAIYLPISQRPHPRLNLLVRGRAGSAIPAPTIRRLVASINPGVTVLGGQTLQDRLGSHVRPQRTASAWVGVFAVIALLLAVIGLYGIVAQSVLQRTRELAVRSALGASPAAILTTVLGGGMRIVAIGAIAGGLGSMASSRLLTSLFAGVRTDDPRPALAAAALLAAAMFAAAYLPARRAARLNPVSALRTD
jgi:predicted permease